MGLDKTGRTTKKVQKLATKRVTKHRDDQAFEKSIRQMDYDEVPRKAATGKLIKKRK
jgi:hypothetical protein